MTGAAGHDIGVKLAAGRDVASLSNLSVPSAGTYALALWLRDEAGNDSAASAVTLPLRYDDVPPGVAFVAAEDADPPELVRAAVNDAHSGPAAGAIAYRRPNGEQWVELPTKLQPGDGRRASLVARVPDLAPGTYVFRAEVADVAGNSASTTLRADGTQMAIRESSAPAGSRAGMPRQAKTRLFARLRGGRRRGDVLTVPFGAPARLSGRLTRADGAGISGQRLRVTSRPSRGALVGTATAMVLTGKRGGFELRLEPGPSRRVAVIFPGDQRLDEARRRSLELRVRSGVSLQAAPTALRTGQSVRLAGRVRSRDAPVPRRGKLVAIQYLEQATGRWRPVLVTRTDHDGRYRARYRFRYLEGSASIRLRATVLAEERWPYAPGSLAPVTVRVSGR